MDDILIALILSAIMTAAAGIIALIADKLENTKLANKILNFFLKDNE